MVGGREFKKLAASWDSMGHSDTSSASTLLNIGHRLMIPGIDAEHGAVVMRRRPNAALTTVRAGVAARDGKERSSRRVRSGGTAGRRVARVDKMARFENTSPAALSGTLNHGGTKQVEPSIRQRSHDREKGIHMPNDHNPPEQHRQQAEGVREKAEDSRQDAEQDRGFTEEHRISAESARNEAEQFRRLAEEAREVRDQHREALETVREERELLREAAETARTAGEEARVAAEAARHATIDAVHATAESLQATLEHMKVVEEMRRTLRDIRDVNKLASN